jgi:hypothetical protein
MARSHYKAAKRQKELAKKKKKEEKQQRKLEKKSVQQEGTAETSPVEAETGERSDSQEESRED